MSKIDLINQKMALAKIAFSRFELSLTQPKLIVKDSIKNIVVNGLNFSFSYVREARFEPNSFFDISIEFVYSATIQRESLNTLQNEGKVFDTNYIEELAKKIVNNTPLAAYASTIIANSTSINGGSPLVTQPSFIG